MNSLIKCITLCIITYSLYCCIYHRFEYNICNNPLKIKHNSNDHSSDCPDDYYCIIPLNSTLVYDIITIYSSKINHKKIESLQILKKIIDERVFTDVKNIIFENYLLNVNIDKYATFSGDIQNMYNNMSKEIMLYNPIKIKTTYPWMPYYKYSGNISDDIINAIDEHHVIKVSSVPILNTYVYGIKNKNNFTIIRVSDSKKNIENIDYKIMNGIKMCLTILGFIVLVL